MWTLIVENFWGALISSLFTIVIYYGKRRLDKIEIDNEQKQRFMDSIAFSAVVGLRNQIYNIWEKSVRSAYITPDQYDIVCEMYEAYVQLGGNHGIEKIMDELKQLPSLEAEKL
jgi:hypothetical protein